MKENKVKILMIAGKEIIEDLCDGGRIISNRNYKLLVDCFGKENVSLIMYSNLENSSGDKVIRIKQSNKISRYLRLMNERCFFGIYQEKKIIDYIISNEIEKVFFDRTIYGKLAKAIKEKCSNCRIYSFAENYEYEYFKNKFHKLKLFSSVINSKIQKTEETTYEMADKVFVLTNRDKKLFSNHYQIDKCVVLPASMEDRFNQAMVAEGGKETVKDLLFIGKMFGPNFDGIKWFVENVMPLLSDYTLTIVGRGFEEKRTELSANNVVVVGSVDELEEYYYKLNIMVMPILYGDGQKIKTVEALMFGKMILATDEALEGYDTENNEGVYRCNSAEEFVEVLKEKFSGEDIIRKGSKSRELYLEKYESESVMEKFKKCFAEKVD